MLEEIQIIQNNAIPILKREENYTQLPLIAIYIFILGLTKLSSHKKSYLRTGRMESDVVDNISMSCQAMVWTAVTHIIDIGLDRDKNGRSL